MNTSDSFLVFDEVSVFRFDLPFPHAIVGGAVRDHLMGLPPKDTDILALGVSPEDLTAYGCIPVDPRTTLPVYLYRIDGRMIEITLPCRKKKTGRGHGSFECEYGPQVTLEEDLGRRDYTINAIAMRDGKIVDPFGGVSDLRNRVLRIVHPDNLNADPLRVICGIRFASTLGFEIEPGTWEAMSSIGREGYEPLPLERFFHEFRKAMEGTRPRRFLELLYRLPSAMEVFMPELEEMSRVPAGPIEYHPEGDLLTHSFDVLDRIAGYTDSMGRADSFRIRLAGFYHDIGKLATPEGEWPRHHGHDRKTGEVLKALRLYCVFPREVRKAILLAGEEHMRAEKLKTPGKLLDLARRLKAAGMAAEDFALLVMADSEGKRDILEILKKAEIALRHPVEVPEGKIGKEAGDHIRSVRGTVLAALLRGSSDTGNSHSH